jgi:hypothetical protein
VLLADPARGLVGLVDGTWKRVRSLAGDGVGYGVGRREGDAWLYDLAADPGERTDRSAERTDVAARLDRRLDEEVARLTGTWAATEEETPARPAGEVDPALAERLRALGYTP